MSAAGKAYMGEVARLGCAICLRMGIQDSPSEVHHPRTGTGAGRRAPDSESIPLCPPHHRLGPLALHVMGRKAFERYWGVTEAELTAETKARVALLRQRSVTCRST